MLRVGGMDLCKTGIFTFMRAGGNEAELERCRRAIIGNPPVADPLCKRKWIGARLRAGCPLKREILTR